MLNKAATLFPPPPGFKRPYLTLGHDPNSRLLEDALPFLRDREVIVLRWGAPETPRIDRSVRWDSSVAADRTREEVDARQRQFRMGKEGRAAHVQRVLEEQRKIAAAEEEAKKSTNEASTSTTDDGDAQQRAATPVPEAQAAAAAPSSLEPAAAQPAVETSQATTKEAATQVDVPAEAAATLDVTASDAAPAEAAVPDSLASEAAAFDAVGSDPAAPLESDASNVVASSSLPSLLEAAPEPASEAAAIPAVELSVPVSVTPAEEQVVEATMPSPSSAAPAPMETDASANVTDEAVSESSAVESSSNEAAPEEVAAPESSPVAPDSSPSRSVLVALAKSALHAAASEAAGNSAAGAPASTQHTRPKKLVSLDHIPLLPKDKLGESLRACSSLLHHSDSNALALILCSGFHLRGNRQSHGKGLATLVQPLSSHGLSHHLHQRCGRHTVHSNAR